MIYSNKLFLSRELHLTFHIARLLVLKKLSFPFHPAMSAAARDAASLSLVHRDLQKVCSSSLVAPLHAGEPSNRHPSTQQYTKAHVTSVRVTLQNKSANFFHAFYWCHRPDWSWRIRYRKYHALPWTASPRTLNPLPILRYVCSQCRTHIYGFLSFLFYHFYFLAIPVGTQSS